MNQPSLSSSFLDRLSCSANWLRRQRAVRRALVRALAAMALLGAGVAQASPAPSATEPAESIRGAVEGFVRAQLPGDAARARIDVQGPAPGLRFPRCEALRTRYFGTPDPYGAQTVEVRCAAPSAWVLYVPVRVDLPQTVLVARRALEAGHTLTADDLSAVERSRSSLPPGAEADSSLVVGQVLRFSVAAGQPIVQGMLTGPQLVRSGQSVDLVAIGPGVRLVALGQAMADGRVGQPVLVRNVQSGRVVTGVVNAQGEVVVQLR